MGFKTVLVIIDAFHIWVAPFVFFPKSPHSPYDHAGRTFSGFADFLAGLFSSFYQVVSGLYRLCQCHIIGVLAAELGFNKFAVTLI